MTYHYIHFSNSLDQLMFIGFMWMLHFYQKFGYYVEIEAKCWISTCTNLEILK